MYRFFMFDHTVSIVLLLMFILHLDECEEIRSHFGNERVWDLYFQHIFTYSEASAKPLLVLPGSFSGLIKAECLQERLFCSCTCRQLIWQIKTHPGGNSLHTQAELWSARGLKSPVKRNFSSRLYLSLIGRLTCLMKSWATLSGSPTHFSNSPRK